MFLRLFGILRLAQGDLWRGLLIAANAGDDTDTIGAIVGAMAGALGGDVPPAAEAQVMAANDLDIDAVARGCWHCAL
ncbi:hypothetical protein HORIV_23400 [Vreelandella olivaria]|uniref:ADP-ribosylglycohydrolase n=1 Tax=Vreelandella olivaria TaxID=390919 RepID=A0ABM7GH42_9GAMM|nr:hypothetical protein HORIV_23400 [Halomonas olivaria]